MAITYQPTTNLKQAAQITYDNMRAFYEHYGVTWQPSDVLEQTHTLDNWDIFSGSELVGVLRLAVDGDDCYLRDLQVVGKFQNKGIGALALNKVDELAHQSGAAKLTLKVFKISPAKHLYERHGYSVSTTDEKFYYMEKNLSSS